MKFNAHIFSHWRAIRRRLINLMSLNENITKFIAIRKMMNNAANLYIDIPRFLSRKCLLQRRQWFIAFTLTRLRVNAWLALVHTRALAYVPPRCTCCTRHRRRNAPAVRARVYTYVYTIPTIRGVKASAGTTNRKRIYALIIQVRVTLADKDWNQRIVRRAGSYMWRALQICRTNPRDLLRFPVRYRLFRE